MKIKDRYRNNNTGQVQRIKLIERIPLTKNTSVKVVQLENNGRWGVTPLLAYWTPIA